MTQYHYRIINKTLVVDTLGPLERKNHGKILGSELRDGHDPRTKNFQLRRRQTVGFRLEFRDGEEEHKARPRHVGCTLLPTNNSEEPKNAG